VNNTVSDLLSRNDEVGGLKELKHILTSQYKLSLSSLSFVSLSKQQGMTRPLITEMVHEVQLRQQEGFKQGQRKEEKETRQREGRG
jgi:hypothetical protein